MKRNSLMQECREFITPEIKEDIDFNIGVVNRIFDLLEERNLSQREFANLLGKNEAEISRWMQGTHNFTIKTIRLIEKRLGAPVLKVVKHKKNFLAVTNQTNLFSVSANQKPRLYCNKNTIYISDNQIHYFAPCLG